MCRRIRSKHKRRPRAVIQHYIDHILFCLTYQVQVSLTRLPALFEFYCALAPLNLLRTPNLSCPPTCRKPLFAPPAALQRPMLTGLPQQRTSLVLARLFVVARASLIFPRADTRLPCVGQPKTNLSVRVSANAFWLPSLFQPPPEPGRTLNTWAARNSVLPFSTSVPKVSILGPAITRRRRTYA